jgi:hypothetical protein
MQEFVHTWLSKIDNPLTFKFTKRKESQLKRVERLNALRKAAISRSRVSLIMCTGGEYRGVRHDRHFSAASNF